MDWNQLAHREECKSLRTVGLTIETAYGSATAVELASRILFRGTDNEGELISKVVLPCPKIAQELLESEQYRGRKDELKIVWKKGKMFIDILDAYLRRPGFRDEDGNSHLSRSFGGRECSSNNSHRLHLDGEHKSKPEELNTDGGRCQSQESGRQLSPDPPLDFNANLSTIRKENTSFNSSSKPHLDFDQDPKSDPDQDSDTTTTETQSHTLIPEPNMLAKEDSKQELEQNSDNPIVHQLETLSLEETLIVDAETEPSVAPISSKDPSSEHPHLDLENDKQGATASVEQVVSDDPSLSPDFRHLSPNLGDKLFNHCVEECLLRRKYYAVLRAVEDYANVVQTNLVAMRGVILPSRNNLIDNLSEAFFGLHAMEISAMIITGRVKIPLGKFDEALASLIGAEGALERIECQLMDLIPEASRKGARDTIEHCKQRLPRQVLLRLQASWQKKTGDNPYWERDARPCLESATILRDLGVTSLQSGDIPEGRKNLKMAHQRMVQFFDAVKGSLPTQGPQRCRLFEILGSSTELWALLGLPGESGKNAADVVRLQSQALEFFDALNDQKSILAAKIRLWNWHRNGHFFLRWTDYGKHPHFRSRLEGWDATKLKSMMKQITKMVDGFPFEELCWLCKKELSWTNCENDGVEILIECKHSYHKSCLDVYVETHVKECPQCFCVFHD